MPLLVLRRLALGCCLVALFTPLPLYAHAGAAPAPHDLWSAWSFAPLVVLSLLSGALLYGVGLRALWRRAGRGRGLSTSRALAFAAGLLSLAVALVSPIDAVAESLFSVHMVQHLLLVVVAPPLLVLGAPHRAMLWALPITRRRALGIWWRGAVVPRRAWRAVRRPGVAWTTHVAALWLWHLPRAYDAALRAPAIHALEHASFLLTALLFWWVVFGEARRARHHRVPVLYLFAAAMQCTVLGAVLTLSRQTFYWGHLQTTRAWGLSPLEDQQLAGLIMWIPGGMVYLVALVPFVLAALRERPLVQQRHPVRLEQPIDLALPSLDHRVQ